MGGTERCWKVYKIKSTCSRNSNTAIYTVQSFDAYGYRYNGFKFEFTSYSFFLALINAIIMLANSVFSISALAKGSISNYSLYLLSGGMVLPVIYGAFTGDSFGAFKIISILFILIGIFIKYDKKSNNNIIY